MKKCLVVISVIVGVFEGFSANARDPRLDEVLAKGRDLMIRDIRPVAVMDLDETTVDSTPRRVASFTVALDRVCTSEFVECNALRKVGIQDFRALQNSYSFTELLKRVGVEPSAKTGEVERNMVEEYLSGRHIELDVPVPGAEVYLADLYQASFEVKFVSSRFEDVQGVPTRNSLSVLGLSSEVGYSQLFLRARSQSSIEFKQKSFNTILSELGPSRQIVGVFENEPENMIAMSEAFPDAMRFFILGAKIKDLPLPEGTHLIRDYR